MCFRSEDSPHIRFGQGQYSSEDRCDRGSERTFRHAAPYECFASAHEGRSRSSKLCVVGHFGNLETTFGDRHESNLPEAVAGSSVSLA